MATALKFHCPPASEQAQNRQNRVFAAISGKTAKVAAVWPGKTFTVSEQTEKQTAAVLRLFLVATMLSGRGIIEAKPGAGRGVNLERSRNKASKRLTRRPATHNASLIHAHGTWHGCVPACSGQWTGYFPAVARRLTGKCAG